VVGELAVEAAGLLGREDFLPALRDLRFWWDVNPDLLERQFGNVRGARIGVAGNSSLADVTSELPSKGVWRRANLCLYVSDRKDRPLTENRTPKDGTNPAWSPT
jgi:hypothetical protein